MQDDLVKELEDDTEETSVTEPSFESFREAREDYEEKVQHGKNGTARLLSVELVCQDEVPEEYIDTHKGLAEQYFLFDAKLLGTERSVTVVCPARDNGLNIQTALQWADVNSVDCLAGQHVPIRHVNGDVYRVETFTRSTGGPDLRGVPVGGIKWLDDRDILRFKKGRWHVQDLAEAVFWLTAVGILMAMMLAALYIPFFYVALSLLAIATISTVAIPAYMTSVLR